MGNGESNGGCDNGGCMSPNPDMNSGFDFGQSVDPGCDNGECMTPNTDMDNGFDPTSFSYDHGPNDTLACTHAKSQFNNAVDRSMSLDTGEPAETAAMLNFMDAYTITYGRDNINGKCTRNNGGMFDGR